MPKVSKLGPGTEGGKQIYWDFVNWRETGFSPLDAPGSVDHYRSRTLYTDTVATPSAFRSQAKKIAEIVIEQMPAEEIRLLTKKKGREKKFIKDSIYKNPWQQNMGVNSGSSSKDDDNDKDDDDIEVIGDDIEKNPPLDEDINDFGGYGEGDNDDDYDDDDYDNDNFNVTDLEEDTDQEEDDLMLGAFFETISISEMAASTRSPYVLRYPNNKVGIVFCLDGDVEDATSNQFELSSDRRTLTRYARVPKEMLNAGSIILGEEKENDDFGFQDANLMVLQALIDERKKGLKVDENGYIWEAREQLQLPFACSDRLYNKQGERIVSYNMRRNKYGFSWGYFWLLAYKRSKESKKRISGQRVTKMEQSSLYTEKSVVSFSSSSR